MADDEGITRGEGGGHGVNKTDRARIRAQSLCPRLEHTGGLEPIQHVEVAPRKAIRGDRADGQGPYLATTSKFSFPKASFTSAGPGPLPDEAPRPEAGQGGRAKGRLTDTISSSSRRAADADCREPAQSFPPGGGIHRFGLSPRERRTQIGLRDSSSGASLIPVTGPAARRKRLVDAEQLNVPGRLFEDRLAASGSAEQALASGRSWRSWMAAARPSVSHLDEDGVFSVCEPPGRSPIRGAMTALPRHVLPQLER